jgi:hypothetical protein
VPLIALFRMLPLNKDQSIVFLFYEFGLFRAYLRHVGTFSGAAPFPALATQTKKGLYFVSFIVASGP